MKYFYISYSVIKIFWHFETRYSDFRTSLLFWNLNFNIFSLCLIHELHYHPLWISLIGIIISEQSPVHNPRSAAIVPIYLFLDPCIVNVQLIFFQMWSGKGSGCSSASLSEEALRAWRNSKTSWISWQCHTGRIPHNKINNRNGEDFFNSFNRSWRVSCHLTSLCWNII